MITPGKPQCKAATTCGTDLKGDVYFNRMKVPTVFPDCD